MTGSISYTLEHDGDPGFDVELEVEFETIGSYQPATWGFDGGSPEEFPEFEVTAIYLKDGSSVPFLWIFGDKIWNPPWKLNLEDLERECSERFAAELKE